MEKYGGKFQKRREETREKLLREKISIVKRFCIITSLLLWGATGLFLGVKYNNVYKWNQDVIFKTRGVWKAMDRVETDVMGAILFLKGCRKDMVFQETPDGFDLQIVETRNQSMEVLKNAAFYADHATPVYLGSGIRPGDELIFCNAEEEKKVQLQVIRNNPKYNYHYLIFPESITLSNKDLPANLIKFVPISYRWEKIGEGNHRLMRKYNDEEVEVLSGVFEHTIEYAFKDQGESYFAMHITMNETLMDGQKIQVKRYMPLKSFERMPQELENVVP